MEKISQTDFNTISHIINYFPISKNFALAKHIKNRLLSKIIFEKCFKQTAYIVAPRNNTLVMTSVPDNKRIGEGIVPNMNFENHMKQGIKNYTFYYAEKKMQCFQFDPFKHVETEYEEDIDTVHYIPLGHTSFYAIVNRETMYRYDNLVEMSKVTIPRDVAFAPAIINGLLYHDLFSDDLVVMDLKTLYVYEIKFQQTTYTTIVSKDYVIIDCSQEDETLPDDSILPVTVGKDEEDTRYMKRNCLFKQRLVHGDEGKIEIEFVKYLPHTLQLEVLDYINGYYWAYESVKMDESTEQLEYIYFFHKENEINKFLIPDLKDVTVIDKFDNDRVFVQYETRIILLSISSGKVLNDYDLTKEFIHDFGVVHMSALFCSVGDYIHIQVRYENKEEQGKWGYYILDQDFKIVQEVKEEWYQLYYG